MYRLPEYHNQKSAYHPDMNFHHPDNHPVRKYPAHKYPADILLPDIDPADTPAVHSLSLIHI